MATPDPTNSQRSMADRNAERAAEEGGQFTTGDWEAVDYWYNQHLSKRNPAAQIANPSALALITFAITTGLLQGATTEWVPASVTHIASTTMFCVGGIVQLLAGMYEFERNNMFAATALTSYGGFWMSYGIYMILVNGDVIPASGPEGLAMAFTLAGLFNFGYMVCSIGLNVALILLFLFLALFNFLAAAGQFVPNCLKAAGYCGELTAAIGLYIAFAELLNETWFRGRIVISLGAMTWPQKLYDRKMSEEREKSQYRRV